MSLAKRDVEAALAKVPYPGFTRDIVAAGVVQQLEVEDGRVRFRIAVAGGNPEVARNIEQAARAVLAATPGVNSVEIAVSAPETGSSGLKMVTPKKSVAASGGLDADLLPGVRNTIAVASGKGGVGKSTVAVNLAVALAKQGISVGLLDADIYGPSIPMMMGCVDARPSIDRADRTIAPLERFDLRFMSLGFLVDPEQAVIWRGPMVMKAITELLGNVAWGELDLLLVDMPPGTGDAQLTLSQKVSLAGAVIVTTPQDVALADAIKGVAMFRKVDVPILGIIENMSYFQCPHCSERSEIFGHGGGRREAKRLGVPFLGEVPLDAAIRSAGDGGEPIVAGQPESSQSRPFLEIAEKIVQQLGTTASETPPAGGTIFDRFRRVWGDAKK